MSNPDSVPSTVEAAAHQLNTSGDHFGADMSIRNAWSLWEADSPLKRDAATNYGIAHADDISGLIWAWAAAIDAGVDFDPVAHCARYHSHWARIGTDSLTAGGWTG